MRRSLFFSALACGVLTLALPAFAQDRTGTWEISPFAGGFFGGRLYGNYTVPFSSGTVTNVRFLEEDDDLAYGARLAYNVTRHFGFEVDWTSSRADLRSPDFFGSTPRNLKVGRLRQNVYEANALFNFGRRRVIGYVGIGAGSAVLKREVAGIDPSQEGRFTANLSAGGRFFFVPRVGLRLDARVRIKPTGSRRAGSLPGSRA
ncbi:MAG: outer membrane beta-barrel protein [Thermoanaerobaculia bacterium]